MATTFSLERNAFGHLELIDGAGERHPNVVAVRAFPLAAPEEGVSIVSADGHELVWIETLLALPAPTRQLVEDALRSREFMPVVKQLTSVSTFATPSTWEVETDRGTTRFVLRGEEDIRRIGDGRLLISDSHGIQYLVPDFRALDAAGRRLLDRFL